MRSIGTEGVVVREEEGGRQKGWEGWKQGESMVGGLVGGRVESYVRVNVVARTCVRLTDVVCMCV